MNTVAHPALVARELAAASAAEIFEPVRNGLDRLGMDDRALAAMLAGVTHAPDGQEEVLRLRERIERVSPGLAPTLVERYALLRVALSSVIRVDALAVPPRVRQLLLEEYLWLTHPAEHELRWLIAGGYVFSAWCKLVTFRRYPAGQLHWEVQGLPRSSLWRVRLRDLPRLVGAVAKLGGFRPTVVPHLAWRRRQIVLSEREHYRSLLLMAMAIELQPTILGFVAEAWFYSPDTLRASPHLAWAGRLFATWGGTVVVTGRADERSGVFEGSRTRRDLAASGAFAPTLGLVIWPRAAMQRWAEHVTRDRRDESAASTADVGAYEHAH